jgi:membrane-bound metal-dependent hydrolase YbcI (DUF457 family)
VALVLAGVAVGAYLPDLDSDSMRMVKGAVMPRFIPRIGRWLLFRIVAIGFFLCRQRFDSSHRGSLHTVFGVALYSTVICFALFAGLHLAGYWDPVAGYFFAGLVAGGLLHLVEDSCTKWGITPFVPVWGHRFRGRIITGSGDVRPEVYASVLFTMAAALFVYSVYRAVPFDRMVELATVTLAKVWLMFFVWSKIPAWGDRA